MNDAIYRNLIGVRSIAKSNFRKEKNKKTGIILQMEALQGRDVSSLLYIFLERVAH